MPAVQPQSQASYKLHSSNLLKYQQALHGKSTFLIALPYLKMKHLRRALTSVRRRSIDKDSDPVLQQAASRDKDQCFIMDIVVQQSSESTTRSRRSRKVDLEVALEFKGLHPPSEDYVFPLKATSPTSWKFDGIIELYPKLTKFKVDVTLVDRMLREAPPYYPFLELSPADTFGYLRRHGPSTRITRDLVLPEGFPTPLTISFVLASSTPALCARWIREQQSLEDLVNDALNDENHPEKAIFFLRMLTDLSPSKPRHLNLCGDYLLLRYSQTGAVRDIDEANSLYLRAVMMTSSYDPKHLDYEFDLLVGLQTSMGASNNPHTRDILVSTINSIVRQTPYDHPLIAERLSVAGDSLRILFENTYKSEYLTEALAIHRTALRRAREMKSDILPMVLDRFALALHRQYETDGRVGLLNEAIELQTEALKHVEPDEEHIMLHTLTVLLFARFEKTAQVADLDQAISSGRRSLAQISTTNLLAYAQGLHTLSAALLRRFENTSDFSNLEEGISTCKRAIEAMGNDHPQKALALNTLGLSLRLRFELSGDTEDILASISSLRSAVQLDPSHMGYFAWEANLGASLFRHSERTDRLEDLAEAISLLRSSSERTPETHPQLIVTLNVLASAMKRRFDRLGDLSDLNESITILRKSMVLSPPDHRNFFQWLDSLAASLLTRYRITGDYADIVESVDSRRTAIKMTPDKHIRARDLLMTLGFSLFIKFDRSKNIDDLVEGIDWQRQAVALLPKDSPGLPSWLGTLALSLTELFIFIKTDDLTTITEAVALQEEAIQHLPKDAPHLLSPYLCNLGYASTARFKVSQDLDDITKAVTTLRKSIELAPDGFSGNTLFFLRLGDSLFERYGFSKDSNDIRDAIQYYRQSATYPTGVPQERLSAAGRWIIACQEHDLPQAFEACLAAVDICSQTVGLEKTIEVRHQNLLETSKILARLPWIALAMNKVPTALEWVEQGRCVVWNQLNELRTPISELKIRHPALASRLLEVSQALETAGARQAPDTRVLKPTSAAQKMAVQEETTKHIQLAKDRDRLLEEIRQLPDFQDFLRPRKAQDILSRLPSDGPVIIILENQDRYDALILQPSDAEPLHIPLLNFTPTQARLLQRNLRSFLSSHGVRMREVERGLRPPKNRNASDAGLAHILRVLWIGIAKPILDRLGYDRNPDSRRRIWWCATGPLVFLPIHAAGIYEKGGPCVADYAVSSYTPTASMLIDKATELKASINTHLHNASSRLLIVSQPNTPDLPAIPGTTQETAMIVDKLKHTSVQVLRLESEEGTTARIKDEILSRSGVHFACHASQDVSHPLQSGFFLFDGRLQLSEIMQLQIPNAEFAFLSACQTSTGDEHLTEEAVHLAAGMLAAGYRGVVATMWSIQDRYGPDVARDFYGCLLERGSGSADEGSDRDGGGRLDGAEAAFALHRATRKMREKLGDNDAALLTWVPYVHYGL